MSLLTKYHYYNIYSITVYEVGAKQFKQFINGHLPYFKFTIEDIWASAKDLGTYCICAKTSLNIHSG